VREKGKASFEVSGQALTDVALFQLVKGELLQEIIVYLYSVEKLKNNGF